MSYKIGQQIRGFVINDAGDQVEITGTFEFRTDDPEEYIQDIVVRLPNGRLQYIDEQDARAA